jgi:ATP-dependent DNA ligase
MLQRSGGVVRIIEPCPPSPAKAPPSGPDRLHEIKHDGFRILAQRDAAGVRLITRNGNDFTKRFPLVVAAVAALPVRSCLIDGEVIVSDKAGLAVFELLRSFRHDHAAPAARSNGSRSKIRPRRPCGARQKRIGEVDDGRHDANQAAIDIPLCSQ